MSGSATSGTREDLKQAFQAGFEASGEGHNGEYVDRALRPPEAYRELIEEMFSRWLERSEP